MPFFGVPIRNGLPIGLGSVAGFGVQQFDPSLLFEGGTVPGAWYDPSDLTTMFTTSAGTTPVAMPGQGSAVSVGLMLDKSQGLVLGANALGSVWSTIGSAIASGSSVTFNSVSDIAAFQSVMTAGVRYLVSFDYNITSGQSGLYVGTNGGTGDTIIDLSGLSGTGSFSGYFRAGSALFIFRDNTGCVASFTNITLKAQLGNHAIAINNTTARPELRARVNLLTYSEEFDNGAWSKIGLNAFGSGSVANTTATLDPLGGNTADYIQENASGSTHYVFSTGGIAVGAGTYRGFVYAKAAERSRLVMGIWNGSTNYELCQFDLANGVILQEATPGIASIESAGNGWWKCSVSRTIGAVTTFLSFGPHTNTNISTLTGPWTNATYTGDGTSGIYIWGADLRPANIGANVPAYQRIADANTYDTNGFPLYLRFDGIDDGMYTPANLNLSATDKVGVFAGVRKLSDAAQDVVAELSATIASNNGTFLLAAPDGATQTYGWDSKGTTQVDAVATGFAAPITNVVTGTADIAGDSCIIRVNGTVADTETGDQGSGNYGTYPLNIGVRSAASSPTLYFNGHLHGLIIAGSAVSASNISATESWMAGKTGISIFNDGPSITLNFDGQTYQVWEI